MNTRHRLGYFAFMMVLFGASAQAHAFAKYKVTELGTISGQSISYLGGVNNSGQVAGYATRSGFLWEEGKGFTLLTAGANTTKVNGITTSGILVGDAKINGIEQAFTWTKGGGYQLLGTGGYYSTAGRAINETGLIAAEATTIITGFSALYRPGTGWSDLGSSENGGASSPSSINGLGHVVGGITNLVDQHAHPYLWTESSGMIDLGLLPGTIQGSCSAINDNDLITGTLVKSDLTNVGFVRRKDGSVMLLDSIPNWGESEGLGINNNGVIVGTYSKAGFGSAYVWSQDTGMVDADSLLDPTYSAYHVRVASRISDSGYIVGAAVINGVNKTVRLDPIVPEPSSWLVFGLCPVLLRRRRTNYAASRDDF